DATLLARLPPQQSNLSRHRVWCRTWLACSTHVYVDMNLLGKSSRKENEEFECIAADVFLGLLVIKLLGTNRVLIASVADIFSFEVGKTCCRCGFGRAVFWLFGNTDIDISASRAIGVDCVEKADPLFYSRSNDTEPSAALVLDRKKSWPHFRP